MSTDIWLFEEPPRRLSQIERRSCQLQRELEHWLFLPTLSMSCLSKKGASHSLLFQMWLLSQLYLVAFLVAACASASDMESTDVRGGKLLPIFQVVKFKNDFCTSTSNSRNGTCYTRWVVQMSLFRLTMDYGHRPITKLNDKLWKFPLSIQFRML